MKKVLLALGVFFAVICGTLAFAASGAGTTVNVAAAASSDSSSEDETPSYGVSIGTVEAQPYSESGLAFDYFDDVEYIAKTSDGTYMGFKMDSDWEYDDETGDEYKVEYMMFVAIHSTDGAVTIPDSIKIGADVYSIHAIYSKKDLINGFNSNIKVLTIPSVVKYIEMDYQFYRYLDAVYMLGKAPDVYGHFQVPEIYVCDKAFYASYFGANSFSNSSILPYGWDFEWITVNVEKPGEFAETYLTQNDYDWNAGKYVKVTGNINNTDLSAIKNLTSLIKLDLSETTITSLPESFMYNRSSLTEIKLPSTINSIGNYAFYGCSSLQSFDLNGISIIGSNVFDGCRQLSYINLSGVITIGRYAFNECAKLNNIDLSSVNYIGNNAFYKCTSLDSINLAAAVSIDYRAFSQCTSLKKVEFGDDLQTLEYSAFEYSAIESIQLPESLTTLNHYVFRYCENLSSVILPGKLTAIGTLVFDGCKSLQEISIPATVTSIGEGAFNNSGIKSFKCYASVPPTAAASFIGGRMDMARTYLYVPPFSKDFYRNTQYWSDFFLMRSIDEPIDYIYVDRPLSINIEEEDSIAVSNNPSILITSRSLSKYNVCVGQLTATGEGTLSAGKLTISGQMAGRSSNRDQYQYMPTLINYADKMRADNVTNDFTFYNNYGNLWHFISLPYDVKVSDIVPGEDVYWVIRRYDSAARASGESTTTWVNLTKNDIMEAGKGYIVSASGGEYDDWHSKYYPTLSFTSGNSITKNNIFRSTDVIVPLTEYESEFAHNRSWNLIGNPYPCYFDMHYLNEEFTAPITVWNGSAYEAYSPVDDNLVLYPYEAFFVQCPLDATEMIFKEGGRMHSDEWSGSQSGSRVMNQASVSPEGRNVFNLDVKNEATSDRARIVLNPDAAMEYEIGRDASKFFTDNSECVQIYVNADVAYSIDERPVGDGIAILGIRASKDESCTLSLSGKYNQEWKVLLTDNLSGEVVDLTEKDYQFVSDGANNSRFTVKFQIGEQSGIDSVISAFGLDANVTVTALNGVEVYSGRLSEMKLPSAGLYIVSDGNEARKAILK